MTMFLLMGPELFTSIGAETAMAPAQDLWEAIGVRQPQKEPLAISAPVAMDEDPMAMSSDKKVA